MGYKKIFSTAATRYGTKNEGKAREEYKKEMLKYHHNFELKPNGLHVNEKRVDERFHTVKRVR